MRVGERKGRQQYYSSDSFDLKDAHKFDKKDHLIWPNILKVEQLVSAIDPTTTQTKECTVNTIHKGYTCMY